MFIKLIIALLIVSLPSCKNTENSLVIADNVKIDASTQLMGSIIGDLIFTPLLYEEKSFVFHNGLVEEITPLPGGKAIEIRIREGVTFHDGREMTESDVAASIRRMMADDKYLKKRYGHLKVDIIDGLKLVITCDRPISPLEIFLLGNIYVSSNNLAGTGPYKFHRWIDNGVELMANDDYFEGEPKLKKVLYRYEPDERKRISMLLNGKADLLVWLSPEMAGFLKTDDRFYVKELPAGFYSAIFLNNDSSLFSDGRLRKAVALAIDRDKLIKKALKGGGIKTLTPLPPQLHTENNTGYSPKEAVRLLKDAGWRDADGDGILEKNGRKLMFSLYYDINMKEYEKIADLISQDLFEIGVGVEAIPAYMDDFTGRSFEGGSYDAILFASSFSDTVNMLIWGSSSHKNLSHFSNMEMDSLLERLREATDIEQKKEIYSKMQRIFDEEAPAVFLYNPVIFTAASKRFKGAEEFVGNAYSMYKIKDWSINNEQ